MPARAARLIQTTFMRHTLVIAVLLALVATRNADAGRGGALVKYLADDTNVVIVVDVAKGRSSAIFKKGFKLAREQSTTLDTLAAATQIDKAVDTIVMGATPNKQGVVVLEGRLDKLLVEAKKQATANETYEGITFFTTSDGEFAVVDKKLVFTSTGGMKAVIDRAKDKKAKGPGTVRTILAATQTGTAVFGGDRKSVV